MYRSSRKSTVKISPQNAEPKIARMTARALLVRSVDRVRARAVSHFGLRRWNVDGSGSRSPGFVGCAANDPLIASSIQDVDELACRVLAGQPQEDILETHGPSFGARSEFLHRAARPDHAALDDSNPVAHRFGNFERMR